MACVNCKKIRSLVLHGKMAEAAGLTIETLREKIGFKYPTEDTTEGLRTTITIDAGADHREEAAKPKKASVVGKAGPEVIAPEDGNKAQ